MRRVIGYFRPLSATIWRALSAALWPSALGARIAIFAAFISVIGALGTVASALFAKDQAVSARVSAQAAEEAVPYARASAEAASETLRRSDENLLILVDVDRSPAAVTLSDENSFFSISFSATAKIINTGGSPAVVTDSVVGTYAASEFAIPEQQSRANIFDASTGAPWPKFVVIRPNEPLRLSLHGALSVSNRQLSVALSNLFDQPEHPNGSLQRKFDFISALVGYIDSHAGKELATEFYSFIYGAAAKPGTIYSNPWSEKEESGYSRIVLKISTAYGRTYRSSPSPSYSGGARE
jgi:hypothetical protein